MSSIPRPNRNSFSFPIEQGRNITLLTLLKIAAFLGVSPATLLPSETLIASDDVEKYVRQKKSSE